jgi:MFS family permease
VGYVARPIGAFFLGHLGDTHGRKRVLLICMFVMGFSTIAVGLLPTYDQVGLLAPLLLVVLRLIQGFAVAGEISGASSMILEHAPFGRRGFFASFTCRACRPARSWRPPCSCRSRTTCRKTSSTRGAGACRSSQLRGDRRLRHPPRGRGDAGLRRRGQARRGAQVPVVEAFKYHWADMLRVVCCSLMNVIAVVATIFGAAYAVQPAYGIGFSKAVYLWIPVLGNIVAVLVIPFVGNLSDKIGRRPPMIFGALGAGLLSFGYLYAISIHSVPLAIGMSLLMWGVVYQGYNAVFPSFYPELFPTRARVSAMAISQNVGTMITAMLPALFAAVAPPGSANIPLTIGGLTLLTTLIAAVSAWSARETYRMPLKALGERGASPTPKGEYDQQREVVISQSRWRKAA